jgi:hypothetical protein
MSTDQKEFEQQRAARLMKLDQALSMLPHNAETLMTGIVMVFAALGVVYSAVTTIAAGWRALWPKGGKQTVSGSIIRNTTQDGKNEPVPVPDLKK